MSHNKLTTFSRRHIGINAGEYAEMLSTIGDKSLNVLLEEAVPSNIRMNRDLRVPDALTEYEYLNELKKIASRNKVFRSYIGQGYNGTITPSVILRNIFENPGWYTQYTPYQAEIAQGRLEALLNFQTVVSDLTGLPIANASLLDEGTAAAEAMSMFEAIRNKKRKKNPATRFFIDKMTYAQTIDIMHTRAKPLDIEIVIGDYQTMTLDDSYIGALIQYPNSQGSVEDYRAWVKHCNENDILVCVAADILSLALLNPPGEWGADAVVGNTQRLGVPMGYGGPHAAYFATKEDFKRQIPGRIIGVSIDSQNDRALRMALQTREQHIKRERATSNICTAQALLAIMAGMYAVYHGPEGIKDIALTIHEKATRLHRSLSDNGFNVVSDHYFDTIFIRCNDDEIASIKSRAVESGINFYYGNDVIGISIDETVSASDLIDIIIVVTGETVEIEELSSMAIPENLQRESEYLTHEVFSSYHTESKMMRYIKKLENKDLSLVHSMIALGSCTMKLNAATELIPVSWPEFSAIHPFAPIDQVEGYQQIFKELEAYLSDITGFTACSLQPNSGAQGEYSGLMTIAAYHEDRGDHHRDIALIPSSAHGTNPASAVMAGMKVVVVKCDEDGNIDVEDLKAKAEKYSDNLASLMVTYPSTHGVFEEAIIEICDIIHNNGGLVYMDGANMNAQVGLTSPGNIGADVCHLNLHKTFAIPHGGGGPGMGPICVNEKLAPFLPGHPLVKTGGDKGIKAVSAAPWGSASILLISYGYIRMLGKNGMKKSTEIAILNANYMKARLEEYYPVLYTGEHGRVAHEMILDLRQFKPLKITAEDIAKRLIDYGFHAPTLSFPVAGTIMIEPTESEDKEELDRFCDALISIKGEIDDVASGKADAEDNVLKNAPHTASMITADEWNHTYKRSQAAYPLEYLQGNKFWPSVGRVDNAHGDRNLICTCPPLESYVDSVD
ncbi:MAG: aminomethyl-transferring glycine dehydrogenase [Saprospiraceae bacterium]|nr:aminomethyl-transferring glycine dehydrogenase [Saprospiraceae bacterium]